MTKTAYTRVELDSCYANIGDGGTRAILLEKKHPEYPSTFHLILEHHHMGTMAATEIDLPLVLARWLFETTRDRLPYMARAYDPNGWNPYSLHPTLYKDGVKISQDPVMAQADSEGLVSP